MAAKRRETAADRCRMAGLLNRLIADFGCVKGAGARVAGPPRQRPEQTRPGTNRAVCEVGGRQRADEVLLVLAISAAQLILRTIRTFERAPDHRYRFETRHLPPEAFLLAANIALPIRRNYEFLTGVHKRQIQLSQPSGSPVNLSFF